MNLRPGLLPLAVVAFGIVCLCLATPAFAQSVTLAWDATPDRSVAGYIVYVGSASGAYEAWYDVGKHTSFTYPAALTGRSYYFAVAAYTAKSGIGAPSEEVVFRAAAVSASQDAAGAPAVSSPGAARPVVCAGDRGDGCY